MSISAAMYHHQTAYIRHKMSGHMIDWKNQPELYKNYPDKETLVLPHPVPVFDDYFSEICTKPLVQWFHDDISIHTLSRILLTAYRITAQTTYSHGVYHYRTTPSAGALYPYELYFGCRSISGLEDGLYHYDIRNHQVFQIRSGNFYTLSDNQKDTPELTFYISVIFFRSSWKYRDRSYRYHLMDTGHLTENIVLTLKAASLPYQVHYDFNDTIINELLGVDPKREGCLSIIKVSNDPGIKHPEPSNFEQLPESYRRTSRVAKQEVEYPLVLNIHAASSVIKPLDNISIPMIQTIGVNPNFSIPIPLPTKLSEKFNFTEALQRRRSLRNFIPSVIPTQQWQTILGYLTQEAVPAKDRQLLSTTICTGFIANSLESLPSGCYLFDQQMKHIGLFNEGEWGNLVAHICLGQEWIANAGMDVFFAVNLKTLEESYGPRGYRYALMNAGRLGQRIYVGAASLGLGCCGIGAFYDVEASEMLELSEDSVMLYLLSVGIVKKIIGN